MRPRADAKSCCVAEIVCVAAANFEEPGNLHICEACGNDVCVKCSRITSWFGKPRQRVCFDCWASEHGENSLLAYLNTRYPDQFRKPEPGWAAKEAAIERLRKEKGLAIDAIEKAANKMIFAIREAK